MRLKNYYRWSFALPIIVPLAVFGATQGARGWVGDVRFALWYSLLIGGPPYLGFAGLSLWKLRNRSAGEHGRFLLVAPIVFAAWLFVFLIAWAFLIDGRTEAGQLLSSGAFFACWGVGLGYTYTGIVHLIRIVLQRSQWVSRVVQ